MGEEWGSVLGCEERWGTCGGRCEKGSAGIGVGQCVEMWGKMWESVWGERGKVCWGVGEVRRDVGKGMGVWGEMGVVKKCGGGMGKFGVSVDCGGCVLGVGGGGKRCEEKHGGCGGR